MDIVDPCVPTSHVPLGSIARVINDKDKTYQDLPSVVTPNGYVITRWTFTPEERQAIASGADLYLTIHSHGPINPVHCCVGLTRTWNTECENCRLIAFAMFQGELTQGVCAHCGHIWIKRR